MARDRYLGEEGVEDRDPNHEDAQHLGNSSEARLEQAAGRTGDVEVRGSCWRLEPGPAYLLARALKKSVQSAVPRE